MKQSKRGASFVHCNLCGNDFSIASGAHEHCKTGVLEFRVFYYFQVGNTSLKTSVLSIR